jgi:hypothetical protein
MNLVEICQMLHALRGVRGLLIAVAAAMAVGSIVQAGRLPSIVSDEVKDDSDARVVMKAGSKVDLELDEKTIVQIAELVLVKVYGKSVLSERPWHVTKGKTSVKIEGTLYGDKGGVAEIEISREDARVMALTHGK